MPPRKKTQSNSDEHAAIREIVRLNVNLNAETADALREIAAEKNISATEAVRRAISVYKYISDEQDDGRAIKTMDGENKNVRELVFL